MEEEFNDTTIILSGYKLISLSKNYAKLFFHMKSYGKFDRQESYFQYQI